MVLSKFHVLERQVKVNKKCAKLNFNDNKISPDVNAMINIILNTNFFI